jgi:hypothetical protein
VKYQLKEAIELSGATPITELNIRERLVAGDLRGIKIGKMASPLELQTEDLLKILGRLTGRTEPEMNALGIEDLTNLLGVLGGFLSFGSSATEMVSGSSTSIAPSAT